jgi:hypothetical protein
MAKLNYFHHVAHITQPNPNDCWATAVAIVMGRHSVAGVAHVKNLAMAGGVQINQDGTLPPASALALARVVHLFCHDTRFPRGLTVPFLEKVMLRSAAAAFGFFNYPTLPAARQHALVLFGLTGDGSPRGTKIHIMDPTGAKTPMIDFEYFDSNIADVEFILSRT